jgi:arginine/lysine/ornithine decarboxylase
MEVWSAKPQLGVLLDHLATIKDTRQSWKVVYPLREMLFLVVCGTIASGMIMTTSLIGAKRICRSCGASRSFTTAFPAPIGCGPS